MQDNNTPECRATCTIDITHNVVTLTAVLKMGPGFTKTATRTWNRRKGAGRGWTCEGNGEFIADEQRIGVELAELMDRLPFPFEVANMLPGKRAAAESVAEAAKAVAHG